MLITLPPCWYFLDHRLGKEVGCPDVEFHDRSVILFRDLIDRLGAVGAGVVDQDVEAPTRQGAAGSGLVLNVQRQAFGFVAGSAKCGHHLFQPLVVACHQTSQGKTRDLPAYACRIYVMAFRASIGL